MIAVLWDLDGTLVDSSGDIAAAVDRTLTAWGLPSLGLAGVRPFIGHGARNLVERCVGAAGGRFEPAMLEHFLVDYRAHLCERTAVHPPGLRALLARVRAPMAVVTNKPEAHSRALLEAVGLAGHFPVVLGGDSLPRRKPDPAPLFEAMRRLGASGAVMVGDAAPDVDAARAAGLPVIGVAWGIGDPGGADVVVADVEALAAALAARGVDL